MSIWTAPGSVNVANLERVGPFADIIVGTEGRTADLNAAYAAGHRGIILAPGAILTAKLTIAANCTIWSPHESNRIALGAYGIEVTGGTTFLAGFNVNGGTGVGIENSGGVLHAERVQVNGFSSHGLLLSAGSNDQRFDRIDSRSNGGDGFRANSGASYARVCNSMFWSNTGYGFNSLSGTSMIFGVRFYNNAAGSKNGSFALDHSFG